MTRRPAIFIRCALLLAAVLLGFGLAVPCMEIQPGYGPYEGWIRLLDPSLTEPSTYSVLSGIAAMFRFGHTGIGLLLLGFSVLFPLIKLAVMAAAVESLRRREGPHWLVGLVHHAGKFSMLDVWVIALLVVAIKGMPGDTEVHLEPGIYLFAGSVVLGLVAGIAMHLLGRAPPR